MILVFKKGSSHTFHGVDCELKRISMSDLREHEKQGWTTDHKELAPKEETTRQEQPKVQKFNKANKG